MSSYNLNDKVGQDFFEFTIDQFKWRMKYPSAKDMIRLGEIVEMSEDYKVKIDELSEKIAKASDEKKAKLQKELEEVENKAKTSQMTMLEWTTGYCEALTENAPDLKDFILSKNVKYLLAFIDMVKTELE
jgi:polyhydroxyalkanoate synthesis regulator phasin